jgi:4-amino-4-deoxy-L-arabinose transferase-like glycosyltransferase
VDIRPRSDRYGPLVLPVCYALALIAVSPIHRWFEEWGGVMQYFAGKELLAGHGYQGWTSGFWPPLYSVLLGLGGLVTSGFAAGKVISILSAGGLMVVAFYLATELTHRKDIGYLTQVFLPLTPLFVFESLRVHNHMLDAFLFATGVLLFFRAMQRPSWRRMLLAGVVCGLAGLTRYTSYVLVALPPFFVVRSRPRRWSMKMAAAFWVGFVVISLPWWIENTALSGSPLHNREDLNICANMFRYEWHSHDLQTLWRCNAMWSFNGAAGWFLANPVRYLGNVRSNIEVSVELLLRCVGILGLFLLPALLNGFVSLRRRHWAALYTLLVLYVMACCQATIPDYSFLAWVAPLAVISLALAMELLDRLHDRFVWMQRHSSRPLFFLALGALALMTTDFKVLRYTHSQDTAMVEAKQVTQALQNHDPDLASKVIMAIAPGRAYYAGSRFVETPADYDGPVQGLVRYDGLDERVRSYAPRYPSTMPDDRLEADYLVYTRTADDAPYWELRELPEYSFLLDPHSSLVPANFEPVYASHMVVVYEIHRPTPETAAR